MSNALAIAGVTAVLKDLLNEGLINDNVEQLGDFSVTTLPPDQLVPPDGQPAITRVNIYLWHVIRNAAFSNERLPAFDQKGSRMDNPYLALNLQYILTTTAAEEFDSEILLGYAMQILHNTPQLTRDRIRVALGGGTPPLDASILPPAQRMLAASDLADQLSELHISMANVKPDDPLQLDTLSNLWSSMSTSLRTSALYEVSCVLIDSEAPSRTSLPVLTIGGQTAQIRKPRIHRIRAFPQSPTGPDGPTGVPDALEPIAPGTWIAIDGTALLSDNMRLMIGERDLTPATINNTRARVQLPTDLRAGLTSMRIEHLFIPEGEGVLRLWEMSNDSSLVVQPIINTSTANGALNSGGFNGTLTVTLTHEVGADQSAAVLLNPLPQESLQAQSIQCLTRVVDGNQVEARLSDVKPGTYLLRAQIDGARSALTADMSGFSGPIVDIQ